MNRILLLEDEDIIRKQLALLLERNNYEVVGASSVEEAVEFYPESFDVILADIRLPGRDGNQILDFAEQVPVIMMTSYCLLYTSPSPRDATLSRMPSSA